MKDLVIGLLVLAIAVQGLVIVGLVGLVNKCRREKKAIKFYYKALTKGLIASGVDTYELMTDYKDAYNSCYKEYSNKFTELKYSKEMYKDLKIRLNKLQDSYDNVCHNMAQAIREGRLIKDKDKISTYDFNKLTKGDVIQLFGRTAVKN